MSLLKSNTWLASNKSSEVYRLEKIDEDDAEDEEKAEQISQYVSIKESNESILRRKRNRCVKCCQHLKSRCDHYGRHLRFFLKRDFYKTVRSIFLISGFSFINRESVRSSSGVAHERVRHLSSYPFMIHPFSLFRWLWDVGMIFAFFIYLYLTPVSSAFYPDDFKKYQEWNKAFEYSIIFFLDILLNMRTGLVQVKTDLVTLDSKKVLRNYFRGWFFLDLISSLPFDGFYLAMVNGNALAAEDPIPLKWTRILVINRLLLIFRLLRYMKRVELSFRLNGLEIRLLNLLIVMITVLHWLACAHYLIPDLRLGKEEHPDEEVKRSTNSWITKMDLWNTDSFTVYMNCLLRALSHLSLIGYGFEAPIELDEIFLSIINIIIGCIFIANTLGYVITILMSLDHSERRFIEVTKQAGEYMRFKQIPKSLQKRVEYYFHQHYRRNFFSENLILSSVSSVLRQELLMHNCQALVEEVPLFHKISRSILQEIVSRLEFEVFLPNDVIIWANTVGDCMYFIQHGTVSILAADGRAICTLHDGDFFGEMSLVFNEVRVATVLAITDCDIYKLDKLDFSEVVQPYPEIYETIVKVAEARKLRYNKENLYKAVKTDKLEDTPI